VSSHVYVLGGIDCVSVYLIIPKTVAKLIPLIHIYVMINSFFWSGTVVDVIVW